MISATRSSEARGGGEPTGAGLTLPALGLALLAFVLRAIYLLESAENPFRRHLDLDPRHYFEWAGRILDGQFFGPSAFPQAPFYAYFLAACRALLGADPVHPLWIQAVLASATVYLGARIAGRRWGRAGLVATGLLLAFYGPGIFYTGVLLAPVLVTFLLACALFAAPRRPLLGGLFAGLATLTHPLVLPGALCALGGMVRATRRAWLLALAGLVIAIAPATIQNAITSRAFVPIATNGGLNLYIGNGPQANGFYSPPPGMRGDQDMFGLAEACRLTGAALTTPQADRFWRARALAEMRAAPGRIAQLYARKLHALLGSYEVPQVESLGFERRFSWLLRLPILPGWIVLLVMAVFAAALPRRNQLPRLLVAGVLLTALIAALFFATARFRYPLHLLLALAAGSSFVGERQCRGAAVVALAALLLFSPNWFAIDRRGSEGQYHHRLGVIAEREGRSDDAMAAYRTALETDPRIARAKINLGILTARTGDLVQAEQLLTEGLTLDPRSARAHFGLGQIAQVRGDLEEAAGHYVRARGCDLRFLPALEFLIAVRYLTGQATEALDLANVYLQHTAAEGTARARALLIRQRAVERTNLGWPLWTSRARAEGDLAVAGGELQKAVSAYHRGLEEVPDDLGALLELTRLAVASGNSARAASWRRSFLDAGGPPAALERNATGP